MGVALDIAHITSRDASEGVPGCPVPCLQRRWEFSWLCELYVQRAPKRVLEVGTYHGGTLYHWLRYAVPGAVVVSVDSPPDGQSHKPGLWRSWAPDGVSLYPIVGPSAHPDVLSAAGLWAPYDWIFIDAGHAAQEVLNDWRAYSAMAAPGAVVALHDILPGRGAQNWIEVAPVWRHIRRQGYVTQEIVASEDVDWGGIGVVYL